MLRVWLRVLLVPGDTLVLGGTTFYDFMEKRKGEIKTRVSPRPTVWREVIPASCTVTYTHTHTPQLFRLLLLLPFIPYPCPPSNLAQCLNSSFVKTAYTALTHSALVGTRQRLRLRRSQHFIPCPPGRKQDCSTPLPSGRLVPRYLFQPISFCHDPGGPPSSGLFTLRATSGAGCQALGAISGHLGSHLNPSSSLTVPFFYLEGTAIP